MLSKPMDSIGFVSQFDSELAAMMDREFSRQKDGLELIASENFASPAVIAAMGSILTNKYAEGLPGKRYYGGCHFVDEIEQLCIDRAKACFGAEFANVQPHSGAQANMAVQLALLTNSKEDHKILDAIEAKYGRNTGRDLSREILDAKKVDYSHLVQR